MARSIKVDFEKNSSVFALFVVSIAVLAIGFVVAKTFVDVAQFNGRVLSERNAVQENIKQNLDNKDALLESYNKLNEQGLGSNVLFQLLPTEYDFAAFTSILNNIALSSGVQLDSIAPETSVESSNELSTARVIEPEPYEVNLTVKGNYQAINAFIGNLQAAAQPIELSQIEINGENEDLLADISLTAYYQQKVGIEAGKETIQ